MACDFSFLEYSYNPEVSESSDIFELFYALGFKLRTRHVNGKLFMCNQKKTIVFVRETDKVQQPGLTGLGFLVDPDFINITGAIYDPEVEMHVIEDPVGYRALLVTSSYTDQDRIYEVVDTEASSKSCMDHFGGIFYRSNNADLMEFYERLGFKLVKTNGYTTIMISSNRRFSITIDATSVENKITTIMSECDDVFATTAYLTILGQTSRKFDLHSDTLEFGDLNHKIMGYNCKPFGNANSYSIENLYESVLPGLDLIIRTRKQYMDNNSDAVGFYYGINQTIGS